MLIYAPTKLLNHLPKTLLFVSLLLSLIQPLVSHLLSHLVSVTYLFNLSLCDTFIQSIIYPLSHLSNYLLLTKSHIYLNHLSV